MEEHRKPLTAKPSLQAPEITINFWKLEQTQFILLFIILYYLTVELLLCPNYKLNLATDIYVSEKHCIYGIFCCLRS